MGFGGIFEGMLFADPHIERAILKPAHDLVRALEVFLAGLRVVVEGGPREINRAFLRQQQGIDGGHRAAGIAEKDHVTARFEAVDALFPRGFGNGIVRDFDALPVREPLDFGFKIPFRVEDDVVCTRAACEGGFFFGGCRADDPCAAHFRHLDEQEANAPAAAWMRQVSPSRMGYVLLTK